MKFPKFPVIPARSKGRYPMKRSTLKRRCAALGAVDLPDQVYSGFWSGMSLAIMRVFRVWTEFGLDVVLRACSSRNDDSVFVNGVRLNQNKSKDYVVAPTMIGCPSLSYIIIHICIKNLIYYKHIDCIYIILHINCKPRFICFLCTWNMHQ